MTVPPSKRKKTSRYISVKFTWIESLELILSPNRYSTLQTKNNGHLEIIDSNTSPARRSPLIFIKIEIDYKKCCSAIRSLIDYTVKLNYSRFHGKLNSNPLMSAVYITEKPLAQTKLEPWFSWSQINLIMLVGVTNEWLPLKKYLMSVYIYIFIQITKCALIYTDSVHIFLQKKKKTRGKIFNYTF